MVKSSNINPSVVTQVAVNTPAVYDGVLLCSVCGKPRMGIDKSWEVHKPCRTCTECGLPWDSCPHLTEATRNTKGGATQLPMVTQQSASKPTGHSQYCTCKVCKPNYTPPTGSSAGYQTSYGSAWKSCEHAQDKFYFKVGEKKWTIYITASKDISKTKLWPSYGMYWDTGWKRIANEDAPKFPDVHVSPDAEFSGLEELKVELGATTSNVNVVTPRYPHVVASWPDHGVIPVPLIRLFAKHAIERITVSKDYLETGCIGAHGRTGVFLACLLIEAEGLGAEEAIKEMRKRHCDKAIESDSQIEAVFTYANEPKPSNELIKALR